MFLSSIDDVDKDMFDNKSNGQFDKRKPIWLRKYNFQSLLNIPEMMRDFGPLVNYWEGSMQGEGYLRLVKPKINSIHIKHWHVNVHKKILDEFALDRMVGEYINDASSNEDDFLEYGLMKHGRKARMKKMFHKYKCIDEVKVIIEKMKPLSLVQMKDGIFNVIIHCGRNCVIVNMPLDVRFIKRLDYVNMNCHHIDFEHTLKEQQLHELDESLIIGNIIALPVIIKSPNSKIECLYYCLDSEWNELSNKSDIIEPMDL